QPGSGESACYCRTPAALLSVVFSDLHAQEIHIEVADLLIIVHLIRDVVDVEGLERLARGPGCRRYPGRRGCREAQALNELPPVHFSLFEILEQFCDDTFHCLSSYSEFRRDSIGLPALCHYTICEGSVGSEHRLMSAPGQNASHRHARDARPMSASPPIAVKHWHRSETPLCAMCGRLRVGKAFLHVCRLVGAAMCSACLCGSHDRWPQCLPRGLVFEFGGTSVRDCCGRMAVPD